LTANKIASSKGGVILPDGEIYPYDKALALGYCHTEELHL
jgi:hypothetical protein